MRERLDRLIKDGKVVGYEKHEGGEIFHSSIMVFWWDIMKGHVSYTNKMECCHPRYILHDRKDQYTGIDIDGVKVFERDDIEATSATECIDGLVLMVDCCWSVVDKVNGSTCSLAYVSANCAKIEFIGIDGVTTDMVE